MKDRWINNDGLFEKFPDNAEIVDKIEPGIWQVNARITGGDRRMGLSRVSKLFEFPSKFYNLHHSDILGDIKKVWESPQFTESGRSLGVVLNGTKGTGKTWYTKLIANYFVQSGTPVILVDSAFDGAILNFIRSIRFDCVVILDEAEKTFTEESGGSNVLLKMIDGAYNNGRRLFLLTTNDSSRLNENLISRPGRIRYIYYFDGIPEKSIDEILEDYLIDKNKKKEIKDYLSNLSYSTVDILKTIIEEVNITGEINENLNVSKSEYRYVCNSLSCSLGTWDITDEDTLKRTIKLFIKHSGGKDIRDLGRHYIYLDDLPVELMRDLENEFCEGRPESFFWICKSVYTNHPIGKSPKRKLSEFNSYCRGSSSLDDLEEIYPGSGIVYKPGDIGELLFTNPDSYIRQGSSKKSGFIELEL